MKKLLVLLFSLFFLSSPSVYADDISDFSIEGMSIGDSLLDYMNEEEILEEIEENKYMYTHLKEPNKYAQVFLFNSSKLYDDGLSFVIKNNSQSPYISNKNEKYLILSVQGMIGYNEDFVNCLKKRDKIVEDISDLFPNAEIYKTGNYLPSYETSGDSVKNDFYFNFKTKDMIELSCENLQEDYREKMNYTEGLNIVTTSAEVAAWLRNK